MSEKRKPEIAFIASVMGKRCFVELFKGRQWPRKFKTKQERNRFRVRIDGTWRDGNRVFTITQVMNEMRSWVSRQMKRRAKIK